MEQLAGGKGWRTQPKEPVKNAQGLTRGDRKRARRAAFEAKVSEDRDFQFLNRSARLRVLAEEVRAAA